VSNLKRSGATDQWTYAVILQIEQLHTSRSRSSPSTSKRIAPQ
jgi:hypothetical protein